VFTNRPLNGHATPARRRPQAIARRPVRCSSGREYDVLVTGFYDERDVLNVEFHYGDVDPVDDPELEVWQTAYVATLGRRVP